jgi:hypothetical protein
VLPMQFMNGARAAGRKSLPATMRAPSRYVPLALSVCLATLILACWYGPQRERQTPLPATVTAMTSAPTVSEPRVARIAREVKHPARPHVEPAAAAANTLCDLSEYARITTARVVTATAAVYIQPKRLVTPLTTFSRGATINTIKREGEWYFIRFEDQQWGRRVGFVHCSDLTAGSTPAVGENGPFPQ